MTTDAAEMQDLFSKFEHLWHSGKDAHLSLECHAGQAWLCLRLHLPNRHQDSKQHHDRQRKPGPSRLRRRERRAKARAAAANAAVEKDAATIVPTETNPEVRKTCETAVQAVPVLPPHVAPHTTENVDDTLGHPTEPEEADVDSATTETTSRAAPPLNANAIPWPHVKDVFCPDVQYLQQVLQPQAPTNQCNICGKTFGSSRALGIHEKRDHTYR